MLISNQLRQVNREYGWNTCKYATLYECVCIILLIRLLQQ